MKETRFDLVLERLLDALEAELLMAPDEEIQAVVAETGMKAGALLADPRTLLELLVASPLEGEVGDAEHRRVGVSPSSHRDRNGGDSTPHPDLRSDLPLKGGGA